MLSYIYTLFRSLNPTAHLPLQEWELAANRYREALTVFPENERILAAAANAERVLGRHQESVAFSKRRAQLFPSSDSHWGVFLNALRAHDWAAAWSAFCDYCGYLLARLKSYCLAG